MEALNKEMQAVSADLYSQAKSREPKETEAGAEEAEGGEQAAGGKDEGEVIDADFEMVDDDKSKS
jgi:hypothetical protein